MKTHDQLHDIMGESKLLQLTPADRNMVHLESSFSHE